VKPALSLLLTAALSAPVAAAAQDKPPIVVNGERLSQSAARERAQQFIRAVGVATGETPAARWIDPVFPVVIGLNDAARDVAEAEVRRIAREAGAPVAAAPCAKNFAITFTPDAGAVARAIAERDPSRVAELSPEARAAVLGGNQPVRWWYITEHRSRDGTPANAGLGGAGGTNQNIEGSGYGGAMSGGGTMQYGSSVLSTLSQRSIASAVVIVDTDGVEGRSLKAVAAYAALVGLAEIRQSGAKPAGSILTMFDGGTPVRSLTRQDQAFLKALYRLPLDRKAQLHRSALVGDMTRDLSVGP